MNAKDTEKRDRCMIAAIVLLSTSIYPRAFGFPLLNGLDLLLVILSMVLLGIGIWAHWFPS